MINQRKTNADQKKKRNKSARLAAFALAACLLCTGCAGNASASVMRLIRTEGTVGVSDEGGEAVSLAENLSLYSGYHMGTETKSYAWINLDSVKLTKMDEESEVEIQKEGKALEIVVNSGELFFNVTEPLEEDETLDIRTSTMTVGIRGTCGWVRAVDEEHMMVYVLEGTVQCTVTDPESGKNVTDAISGGEKAELILCPEKEEKCEIVKEKLELYEIPLFVLTELFEDDRLCEKINEASGLDVSREGLPERCLDKGREEMEQENWEVSAGYLTMAAELAPELTEAYVLRGNVSVFSGETEENLNLAQADYETALEQDETDVQAWLGLADISIRRGAYDEALDILQEGLDKTGNDSEIAEKIEELKSGTVTDSQHKTRRMSSYDEAGGLMWYHEYFYDEQGRAVRVEAYDGAGGQTGVGAFSYDEEGRRLQSWGWMNETGVLVKSISEYDEAGNQVRVEHYDVDGSFVLYYVNEFDSVGNLIRETAYGPDGMTQGYTERKYDGNRNEIRSDSYGPDGTLYSYCINEYGENGKKKSATHYNADGTMTLSQIYEYDADGNQVAVRQISGETE